MEGLISKSENQQYRYREILVDPDILSTFHCTNISEPFDFEKQDELLGLKEKLIIAINDLIATKLTSRQSEVVQKIYFEKKTQMEVADSLGLCQTTIHKIIQGNIDYKNNAKRYGGALKKLGKLCKADPSINSIIQRMTELQEELADTSV